MNWHSTRPKGVVKINSLSLSIASMVKSFTDYWLVRLPVDKKTLSSYLLIKVSKCLVAATCWYVVFLLNRSTKITPKFTKFVITFERSILSKSPNQNVDKCLEVHTVGLLEVWSHHRWLWFFCKVFRKFKAFTSLDNLLDSTV